MSTDTKRLAAPVVRTSPSGTGGGTAPFILHKGQPMNPAEALAVCIEWICIVGALVFALAVLSILGV